MKRSRGHSSRHRGNRQVNSTILIVCERKNDTERIYFENFKGRRSLVDVVVDQKNKCKTPADLVQHASDEAEKRNLNLEAGDSVWCVLDVDVNENVANGVEHRERELQEMWRLADKNSVNLALSNPSFELWYLLHFERTGAHLSNQELLDRLKKRMTHYHKTKNVFQELQPRQPEAIENAKKLNAHHERQGNHLFSCSSNPSSQVFKLVTCIHQTREKNEQGKQATQPVGR